MTKKAIKDLPERNGAKEGEALKNEDLGKVTGGLGVIGGVATKSLPFVSIE
jgi:hypothetical protein